MYTGPITDPHQHLWDYKYKYSHGWLQIDSHPWTGDWTMLANNYLIDDYFEDIKNQNLLDVQAAVLSYGGYNLYSPALKGIFEKAIGKKGKKEK